MTSEKQIEANRRNAAQSTGPTSAEGKEAVRFNALKHGLTARQSLLPDEDSTELELLQESLFHELGPEGPLEKMLVERIVQLTWRLQRASKIEMGAFVHMFCEQVLAHEFAKADSRPGVTSNNRTLSAIAKKAEVTHRQTILNNVSEPKAKARIKLAREQADDDLAIFGAAYRRDAQEADVISKLMRYETTLEKSLFRALHELQRLQDKRAGEAVPPPIIADINISTE